jgi:hypothetical protein
MVWNGLQKNIELGNNIMLLEHSKETEKLDTLKNKRYRWLTTDGETPLSDWMDLDSALEWAIQSGIDNTA